jgi:hypothetical protein
VTPRRQRCRPRTDAKDKDVLMTDQERNQWIAQKLGEGLSLSDVQKLLASEYGVRMTYLDLRLLAAELPVKWAEAAPAQKPEPVQATVMEDEEDEGDDDLPPTGTAVTISKLVRPGAAMSGEVAFASGAKAEWFLDATGRLGLTPAAGSTRPTQDDLREFQIELQRKLSGVA